MAYPGNYSSTPMEPVAAATPPSSLRTRGLPLDPSIQVGNDHNASISPPWAGVLQPGSAGHAMTVADGPTAWLRPGQSNTMPSINNAFGSASLRRDPSPGPPSPPVPMRTVPTGPPVTFNIPQVSGAPPPAGGTMLATMPGTMPGTPVASFPPRSHLPMQVAQSVVVPQVQPVVVPQVQPPIVMPQPQTTVVVPQVQPVVVPQVQQVIKVQPSVRIESIMPIKQQVVVQQQQQQQVQFDRIEQDPEIEYHERLVEVPTVTYEIREEVVEVPEVEVTERVVHIPQVVEVVKEIPGEVEIEEVVKEVPVYEVYVTEHEVEVPVIVYKDVYREVPMVQEVVRHVPRITVQEIPIERIIRVPKKIIQEKEQPVYKPVPHLVRQAVEREILVPKVQIETKEVVTQIPVPDQHFDKHVNMPYCPHCHQTFEGEAGWTPGNAPQQCVHAPMLAAPPLAPVAPPPAPVAPPSPPASVRVAAPATTVVQKPMPLVSVQQPILQAVPQTMYQATYQTQPVAQSSAVVMPFQTTAFQQRAPTPPRAHMEARGLQAPIVSAANIMVAAPAAQPVTQSFAQPQMVSMAASPRVEYATPPTPPASALLAPPASMVPSRPASAFLAPSVVQSFASPCGSFAPMEPQVFESYRHGNSPGNAANPFGSFEAPRTEILDPRSIATVPMTAAGPFHVGSGFQSHS